MVKVWLGRIFQIKKKPKYSFKIGFFWHLSKYLIHWCVFFLEKRYIIVLFVTLQKVRLEKSGFSVRCLNAVNQSVWSLFWSSLSLEGINRYLRFLAWRFIGSATTTLGRVWPVVVPLVQSDWSTNISGKNLLMSVFFHGVRFFARSFFARLHLILPLVLCGQVFLLSN